MTTSAALGQTDRVDAVPSGLMDSGRDSTRAGGMAWFKEVWIWPNASEVIALVLLIWMLAMVGWSVQLARWGDLPNIIPTAIIGAAVAFTMSRLRVNWSAKLVMFALVGTAVIFWQGSLPADGGNVIERSIDAWARFQLWIDIAINGGVSGDTVPFAMLFMTTTWVVGYSVSALTFKTMSPWVPVMALGFGLLTNLSHRSGQFEYTFYLFVIGATAQFAHLIAYNRTESWLLLGLKPPRSAKWQSARDGLVLGALIVLIAALMPFYEISSVTLKDRWNAVFLDPFLSMRSTAQRLLAGVPSGKDEVLEAPKPVLPFKGAIELTDDPLFRVRSRFAKMHPGRIYQEYTSQGWVTAPSVTIAAPSNARLESDQQYLGTIERELVELAVQPAGASNLVVPAGGVRSVNLPAAVDVLEPIVWDFPLTGPIDALQSLPEDFREFAYAVRYELLNIANKIESIDGTRFTIENQPAMDLDTVEEAVGSLYYYDTNIPWERFTFNFIDSGDGSGVGYVRIVRDAPVEHNVVVLRHQAVANQQFLVSTSVSIAEEDDLQWANDEYPGYIKDRYLQLPASLPGRVLALATGVVSDSGAETPWEKAQAVKAFLQDQVYSLEIDGPNPFSDALDYFLFETVGEPCPSDDRGCDESKIKGYSQYFGSAATVLLRANGVPARFIAGWSAGEYLPSEGQFLVRDRNRHGWTQVYLPPFGWIDLEVTPGRAAVPRNLRVPTAPINDIPAPVTGSAEFDPDFLAELAYLDSLALDAELPSDISRFGVENRGEGGSFTPPWMLMGAGAAGMLALFAIWMAWRWDLRGQDDAVRAYTQWTRVAMLLGYRRPRHMSAREYGERLGSVSEHTPRAAKLIIDNYEARVYGGPLAGAPADSRGRYDDEDAPNGLPEGATTNEDADLRSAWRTAATALFKHRVRRMFGSAQELHIGD